MHTQTSFPFSAPSGAGKPPPYTPRHKLLPIKDRPDHRVRAHPTYCSDIELLAALIGGVKPLETAEALLSRHGSLYDIASAPVDELRAVPGVGDRAIAQIKASTEFGRRIAISKPDERPTIHSPADAAALVQYEMSMLEQEELRVMLLDTRNRVIEIVPLYRGSVNSSQIRVGEIFKQAIRCNATAVVIIHNHPSGDPTPSPDDVAVTRAIVQAGKLMDFDVLDHLVIARSAYVSLKERGLGFS
jgi:DNA repair protein RadC